MNTPTPKQREELDLAERLLSAVGHGQILLVPSDRPDVVASIGDRRVGIEVTRFHADERTEWRGSGSLMREREGKLSRANPNGPYHMWGFPDPIPGLVARIGDKIKVAEDYDGAHFDELWLLVSGGDPKLGAVVSSVSLSGILCVGHSMTNRSMYANQQEDDEGGHGRCGGDAVDPQGAH